MTGSLGLLTLGTINIDFAGRFASMDCIGKIEDALRQAEARLAALGTFQVATAIALDRVIPNYGDELDGELDKAIQGLANSTTGELGVLNGIRKQFYEKRGLPAND